MRSSNQKFSTARLAGHRTETTQSLFSDPRCKQNVMTRDRTCKNRVSSMRADFRSHIGTKHLRCGLVRNTQHSSSVSRVEIMSWVVQTPVLDIFTHPPHPPPRKMLRVMAHNKRELDSCSRSREAQTPSSWKTPHIKKVRVFFSSKSQNTCQTLPSPSQASS